LKRYNVGEGQMGYIADYDIFLDELDRVWAACFHALVPGGRLICVVGDVCLSRRKNKGEHLVFGPQTTTAVGDFQKIHNMPQTGAVDTDT
jgi:hypothetical protein